MHLENTIDRFGSVARGLHALVAILFLAAFASVYGRRWFTDTGTPENLAVLQLHLTIGLSLLVLAGLRLWWRLRSRVQPQELPGSPLEHAAARLTHIALYALMFLMPITGYLGTGVDTQLFGILTVPRFADTAVFDVVVAQTLGLTFEEFEQPIDWMHKVAGELLILTLVGLHVSAAMFHHFVRRDGALSRMFGGGGSFQENL